MRNFGKYLVIIICGIIVCIILSRVGAYDLIRDWGLAHSGIGENNLYKSYVGNYEYSPIPITSEYIICQDFQIKKDMLHDEKLYAKVLFGVYERKNQGIFHGVLLQGDYVQDLIFDMAEVNEGEFFQMEFVTEGLDVGTATLMLYSDIATENNCIAPFICHREEAYINQHDLNDYREIDYQTMFGYVKVNDTAQNGALVLEICTR